MWTNPLFSVLSADCCIHLNIFTCVLANQSICMFGMQVRKFTHRSKWWGSCEKSLKIHSRTDDESSLYEKVMRIINFNAAESDTYFFFKKRKRQPSPVVNCFHGYSKFSQLLEQMEWDVLKTFFADIGDY